jgi:hypothetical protein
MHGVRLDPEYMTDPDWVQGVTLFVVRDGAVQIEPVIFTPDYQGHGAESSISAYDRRHLVHLGLSVRRDLRHGVLCVHAVARGELAPGDSAGWRARRILPPSASVMTIRLGLTTVMVAIDSISHCPFG